jgi:hypothetical protein
MDGDNQSNEFIELFSRLEFHIGGIFSRQSASGKAYQEISASYLILFVNFNVFTGKDGYFTHMKFRDETGEKT